MASTEIQSTSNNVEEHKRVSFGGEKQIVYDDGIAEDYALNSSNGHATRYNAAFTDSNAPPNKVTVHAENSEVPRPISPPAQLSTADEAHGTPVISISPALPSFLRKMENESNENPFRPEESLYHEVDPIVKAYRQRPFPPSPSGSPIPAADQNGVLQGSQTTPYRNVKKHPELTDSIVGSNGRSKDNGYYERTTITTTTLVNSSKNSNTGTPQSTTTIIATSTPKRNGGSNNNSDDRSASRNASLAEGRKAYPAGELDETQPLTADGSTDGSLPPPHKAQIVHIEEKKKKCRCCCLQ